MYETGSALRIPAKKSGLWTSCRWACSRFRATISLGSQRHPLLSPEPETNTLPARGRVLIMSTWQALLGRVTLFPAIPSGADIGTALEYYRRVWKSDPDNFNKQSQMVAPLGLSFAQGTASGISLTCSVNPTRIDFSITPPARSDGSLGLMQDTRQLHFMLTQIVTAFSEGDTIPVNRGACFVQFANAAGNYRKANEILLATIPEPYNVRLEDEEDFILQVNHPRLFGETKMNIITKWSTDRIQVLSLQASPVQTQMATVSQLLSEHIVSSIAFDNSNAPTSPLSNNSLSTILSEALSAFSAQKSECNLEIDGF
jgi:hypothetical protein